ncbi:putative laforin [Gregarina niphandrodes]|uniref:Laforin n=1 Tax=Gregarina niphandrodes TaxID=110365 RepID=A0A023BD34_GRENI|nr:putative laforin [Gregarina niphandrodes]EZG86034.1 putative laforin [Gregarina niphandrodes]|eukprot:XP_011128789.1 putative laforin [Gregarina niphandrodes]
MVLVLFSVSTFVEPGTEVAVVGSSPSLGTWCPENAIPLYPQTKILSSLIPTTFMNWIDMPEITLQPGSGTLGSGGTRTSGGMGSGTVTSGKLPRASLNTREPIGYKFVRQAGGNSGSSTRAYPTPLSTPTRSDDSAQRIIDLSTRPVIEEATRTRTVFNKDGHRPRFVLNTEYASEWTVRNKDAVQWEGSGSQDNRFLVGTFLGRGNEVEVEGLEVCEDRQVDDRANIRSLALHPHPSSSPGESAGHGVLSWVFLPVADFFEPQGVSEYSQTTRYYFTVKGLRSIHFAKVIDNVFVGSCPRSLEHLRLLKRMNVGCVFNFQANDDLPENWLNEADPKETRHAAALAETYHAESLSLVHLPTVDMSTPARSALMAQSACLMANYLAANLDRAIYIHCNAGVGRAVAGALSLLHFVLGMPEAEAVAFLKQRRPMAYPDLVALRAGLKDYTQKYANSVKKLLGEPTM